MIPDHRVTELLVRTKDGDEQARDELLGVLYSDLHSRARRHMEKQRPDHTLQATALVNEAYVKLLGDGAANYADKRHFLAVASRAMGQIVIDHARKKQAIRHGGGAGHEPLDELVSSFEEDDFDLLALGEALEKLEESQPDLQELVQLRFFGGLTMQEIADHQGIPLWRCERNWTYVRSWLRRFLDDERTRG